MGPCSPSQPLLSSLRQTLTSVTWRSSSGASKTILLIRHLLEGSCLVVFLEHHTQHQDHGDTMQIEAWSLRSGQAPLHRLPQLSME